MRYHCDWSILLQRFLLSELTFPIHPRVSFLNRIQFPVGRWLRLDLCLGMVRGYVHNVDSSGALLPTTCTSVEEANGGGA